MRFGKHTINPLALARRLKSESHAPALSPVACEERDALLSAPLTASQEVPVMSDETGANGGDPTQRLLTALGRFQRHVARAEAGAAQETWSDECMNQLIAAFEIAKRENWNDVVEALTETARVLQTYEESGCAADCVPFLADSYEILCLMVGDLIVGSVRTGVMEKWRRRYERALADIGASGLVLVQDDSAGVANAVEGAFAPDSPVDIDDEAAPFELPPLEPLQDSEEDLPLDEDLPTLDDLPPLTLERAESGPALVEGAVSVAPPETLESVESDSNASVTDTTPLTTMLFDAEVDGATAEPESLPEEAETATAGPTSDTNGMSPQVVEVLDKLCECLSRLGSQPGADRLDTGVAMEYSLTFLQRHARDYGRMGAFELCREMEKICRLALAKNGPLEDRFFELSYAFCGAYVDANSGPQDPVVTNWIEECETLVEQWRASKAETPSATPMDEAVDGTPERLLETAQRAVERGNSGDAKVLALQAAVNIARTEAAETEARVRAAESRLQEGAKAIELAHASVREAEHAVTAKQSEVSAAESHVADRRTYVSGVERKLSETETRIAELEEQARALQSQLNAEVQSKGETLGELADARVQESAAQSELEQALADEDTSRVALEQARQSVKHLQQKRTEIEAALERMRDALTRRRASLADLEQTMNLIRGASEPDLSEDQELLF